jgi:hypothetical protein
MANSSSSQFLNRTVNNYAFYIICASFLMLVLIKVRLATNFSGPFILPDEVEYNSVAQNIIHGKLYRTFRRSLLKDNIFHNFSPSTLLSYA